MNLKVKIFSTLIVLGLTFANVVSADLVKCGGPGRNGVEEPPCRVADMIYLIERIINFLLAWAWLIAIFYVMWGAYNMISAGGNSEALDKAKTTFSQAIIGFFLIMAGYLLVNWIVGLLVGDSVPRAGVFDIYRNLLPSSR